MDPLLDQHLIPENHLQLPEKYAHLSPQQYAKVLLDFIEKHKHWTTMHIVDFITMNQWETIMQKEWCQALLPADEYSSQDQWINSIIKIASGSDMNEEWPDSLKTFIRDTRDIALPRLNKNGCKVSIRK
ncbi:uncharacterized protein B0P05DRAFT_531722 [Gilbertella persicaria]|uniref:uncharacterized protein n=1 Tax=Gilbertella persicaria TaxID=101096 RepID=UPI0022200AEC|nr:uncharacterized protein B0P05DRAFT_531722 [Gilbertella persicaria]KAI8087633.1 hypothetical protein B0P05DRAFT_531722 [Gilbertella persicaria]